MFKNTGALPHPGFIELSSILLPELSWKLPELSRKLPEYFKLFSEDGRVQLPGLTKIACEKRAPHPVPRSGRRHNLLRPVDLRAGRLKLLFQKGSPISRGVLFISFYYPRFCLRLFTVQRKRQGRAHQLHNASAKTAHTITTTVQRTSSFGAKTLHNAQVDPAVLYSGQVLSVQ